MKRCVITIVGNCIALDHIEFGDPLLTPIRVECTTKQFRKELLLWLQLFDYIWPTYQSNTIIGKLVN